MNVPSGLTTTVPLAGSVLAVTVRASPSGSLSLPSRLPPTAVSSSVVKASSVATGGGLPTVQVKLWLLVRPPLSVAVIVTLYTPSLPGPPWLAEASSVPLITPVTGSMLNPGGRPAAL